MDQEYFNIKPSELATEANALDCHFWEAVRADEKAAQNAFPDRAAAVVGNDLFNTLYHYQPRIREDAPEAHRAKALQKLMDSSEWMQLHDATMNDEQLAAAGAVTLRDQIKLDPEADKVMDNLEEIEREQEKLEALEAISGDLPADKADQIAQAKAEAEAKIAMLGEEVDKALGDHATVKAIRRGMKEAAEDLQNAQTMAGGWGKEEGTLQEILFDPEMSRVLTGAKIKRIMEIAGHMREVVSAERSKRPKPGPQKVSLELGDDLSRVVSTELAMLGDPDLEAVFDRKYMERALMQTKRDEKPKEGKGPFVVCIDESGSMAGAREEWAKALTLAIAQQAHTEKRPFGAVAFGNKSQLRQTLKPGPAEFLNWLNSFYNGGTDFETPLEAARDMVVKTLPNADIIFITDGECGVSEEFTAQFKKDKEANNIKVIGVQIGEGNTDCLKSFSDCTYRLSAARGAAGLEAIIGEMK